MLTTLFYHVSFFFFLIIDLYFLIPAATAQIFNPIAELLIPIGIPSKEAKAEIETHPITAEAKIALKFYLKIPLIVLFYAI